MTRRKNRQRDESGQRPQDAKLPTTTAPQNVLLSESPEPSLSILSQQKTLVHQSSFHSGPLPAPEDLKAYNDIEPGLADRIVKMAEAQLSHRQGIEKQVITSDLRTWEKSTSHFYGRATGQNRLSCQ